MRVEAIRKTGGFFIPINEELETIVQDRIVLDIEIVRPKRNHLALPDFFGRARSVFGEDSGKDASACVTENREERF